MPSEAQDDRDAAGGPELGFAERTAPFAEWTAIADRVGSHSYAELAAASARVAVGLLAGRPDLDEARVALLVEPGFAWAAVEHGTWRAGGVAVPLALSHPSAELEHVLGDSGAEAVVASPDLASRVEPLCRSRGLRLLSTAELLAGKGTPGAALPEIDAGRRALIVYTSGTTGRPKGAVWTHRGLAVQMETLVRAWGWVPTDRALHVLPLHHVHGLVNVLGCALAAGATCEMQPRFDAGEVWERLASGEITVFMAVPTLYHRLLEHWERQGESERARLSTAAARLRLMVSGSAALPAQVFARWREVTGHALLERYGMTEIGMALSNPLAGERIAGTVGRPLPGVEVRVVDESGRLLGEGHAGELEVRGPGLFREYWQRPEETARAFRDGWFRTGDTAVVEGGIHRILGRSSVDIVKTGGYKVSALEIETALRDHPSISDCAVVGLPDPEWGERVAATVVLSPGAALDLDALRAWGRDRLAPYKLPSRLLVVDDLPRNAMGKVVKAEVVKRFGPAAG